MLVQLQYVRGIAALLVVYFHSVLQWRHVDPGSEFALPLFGEIGVDLFFVLSGFVMWLTTADRDMSPVEFYKRRIERIVPLYWVLTVLAAGIAFAFPEHLKSTVFDLPHVLASLFFVPWLNPANTGGNLITPVIIPGWTLNYEMYFYLIFGGFLLVSKSVRLWGLLLLFLAVYLGIEMFGLQSVAARFYGNAIVFEFLAGVLIGGLFLRQRTLPQIGALLLLPVATLATVGLDIWKPEWPRLVSAGLPAALIILCLVSIDFGKIRESRFLHLLGDASYSLYLTHVFTLVAVRIAFMAPPLAALANGPVFLLSCMAASVLVALISYWAFEKPVADYFKKRRMQKRASRKFSPGPEEVRS